MITGTRKIHYLGNNLLIYCYCCRKIDELSAQVEHLLAAVVPKSLSPAPSWNGFVFDEGLDHERQREANTSTFGIDTAPPPFGTPYVNSIDRASPSGGCAGRQNDHLTSRLSDGNRLSAYAGRTLEDVAVSTEQIDCLFME